ncbi:MULTISPECIES: restriction endonuclease subunit S [unclassified Acinetobacter]|uniref:restriction endonuclease subunit S n=1 Tax=unclassified Acinetobacter TaxID=196816 RepID=UPI0015D229FC|nr:MULTISPECIES: restriction endonuclease subunit S [unclassified Acinetobacter]UUS56578.1 restriction endonuclease subunit S [Acinetobacter sp. YH16040_T]
MSLDNLPVEWLSLPIEKVAEVKGGKRLPKGKTFSSEKTKHPYIRVTDMGNGSVDLSDLRYIDEETYQHISNYIISIDDLYISIAGTIGLVGSIPDCLDGANLTENAAKICNLQGIERPYLKYVLNSQIAIDQFDDKVTSSGQPKLALFRIRDCRFPYPPLAEQQEIVRQLDMMLAQVEQIKARLDAIPAILKKFRQSVLESYFNNLASVQQVNLDDLVVSIDQGWSPKCLNTPASAEQWGVIKTSAIQPLYFDASENKELPSNLKPREALSLISGDVLITRAGPRARCGVTCIVDKDYDNLMICDKVYRVRCDSKKISADYLNLYLNSLTGLSLIEKMKTGSSESGMNLTQSKFKELVIPLVSLKQQLAFAKDIKKFFQLANHIEETVQSAQKRVNLLTQSILAKAFSGELTAEWREQHQELITGVNSAESLLAKIQAEREASKSAKKTRKKKEV